MTSSAGWNNYQFVYFLFQYHGAPIEYMDVLSDCNLVFTILFTIECVMKLSSFGPKAYFKVSVIIIVLHLLLRAGTITLDKTEVVVVDEADHRASWPTNVGSDDLHTW